MSRGWRSRRPDERHKYDANSPSDKIAVMAAAPASSWLWVVREQLKFDSDCEREGIVTSPGGVNSGMSVGGFYRTMASVNTACGRAFYSYMKSEFGWDRQDVLENMNEHLPFDLGDVMGDGTALYNWEGPVRRNVWKLVDGEEKEVSVEQYAVITFWPFAVVVSD